MIAQIKFWLTHVHKWNYVKTIEVFDADTSLTTPYYSKIVKECKCGEMKIFKTR